MSVQAHPRPGETKTQARNRVKVNLDLAIKHLEKAMGPLDIDSDLHEEMQEAYDKLDAIWYDEFGT